MPYITGPPPPPYLVAPSRASIINQIEYYFRYHWQQIIAASCTAVSCPFAIFISFIGFAFFIFIFILCSEANLVKDAFLRSKMDEQGWVPITLIADFPRVSCIGFNVFCFFCH